MKKSNCAWFAAVALVALALPSTTSPRLKDGPMPDPKLTAASNWDGPMPDPKLIAASNWDGPIPDPRQPHA